MASHQCYNTKLPKGLLCYLGSKELEHRKLDFVCGIFKSASGYGRAAVLSWLQMKTGIDTTSHSPMWCWKVTSKSQNFLITLAQHLGIGPKNLPSTYDLGTEVPIHYITVYLSLVTFKSGTSLMAFETPSSFHQQPIDSIYLLGRVGFWEDYHRWLIAFTLCLAGVTVALWRLPSKLQSLPTSVAEHQPSMAKYRR